MCKNNDDKAKLFNGYFVTVYAKSLDVDINVITFSCKKKLDEFIIIIPAITDYRQKVENNIPSGCLKNCSSQHTILVEALFNEVFSNLTWSAYWKGSYITPSYKLQGNHNELLNF